MAERAIAVRLKQTEVDARAELLNVQQQASSNLEAVEKVAQGRGIMVAEAASAYERVEYEARRAMHNAVVTSEAMEFDLRAAAETAAVENYRLRAELASKGNNFVLRALSLLAFSSSMMTSSKKPPPSRLVRRNNLGARKERYPALNVLLRN